MKTAIYARISTTDKGQDVDLQLNDLRVYAKARGWDICNEYIDRGQSGVKDRRPALDSLMEDCLKRKIDTIIVWRLDRFGRSLKHLINTLDELRHLNVSFVSYHENLDFTSSTGLLLFHLLGAFAEFERNLLRDRVKAGLANARTKGRALGRPGKEVDPVTVGQLKKTGITIREIAKELGISIGLVHKTLSKSSPQMTENQG